MPCSMHHYRYFILWQITYHTGIRPKESLALKISDIDLEGRLITIEPEIETENSKTKSIRKVPINHHLFQKATEQH